MAHQLNPTPEIPPTPEPNAPTEPALAVGTIAGIVGGVIALLVAFGFELPEGAKEAIIGLVMLFEPIIIALLIRKRVWSPATVARKVQAVRDTQHRSGGGL